MSSVRGRRSRTRTAIQPAIPQPQSAASICPRGQPAATTVLTSRAEAASVQLDLRPARPRSSRTEPAVTTAASTSHAVTWTAAMR